MRNEAVSDPFPHRERERLRVSDPFSHRKRENPVHPEIPLAKIPLAQRMTIARLAILFRATPPIAQYASEAS